MTPPMEPARVPCCRSMRPKPPPTKPACPTTWPNSASSRCCSTIRDWRGAFNDLLATMLWHGALDPRLRELVIMRIGWLTGCDYEWTQHWRVASRLGVPAEDLLGVRDWQATQRVRSCRAGGAGGHRRRGARRRGERRELGGLRARIEWRHNGSHRACHRDRCLANGRFDAAQPRGPAGGGRVQLAARRESALTAVGYATLRPQGVTQPHIRASRAARR